LPPPKHSIASPTKLPPPAYDGHHYDSQLPRNDYNQAWSREGPSLPTLQHIAAPYYPSRSELGNRNHESHSYTHREIPQNSGMLPIPTSALAPRPRISDLPRRSSITHAEHSMRYTAGLNHHQTSDNLPANMHFGYNPAQESRQASLPERQNGNAYEEQQFWPPPAEHLAGQPAQFASSKEYQGFNNR